MSGRQAQPSPALVYGRAPDYLQSGLGWPLPLPPRRKRKPPTGFTGREGRRPTPAKIEKWAAQKPGHNLALRLAPGVLGVDVDAYPPKRGRATLARALDDWGPLPDTIRSSAREDGISGIYLFRVPQDLGWPSAIPADLVASGPSGDVELVHYGLRYVVAWPSIHPEGLQYRWWAGDVPLATPPALRELPYLPDMWVEALDGLASRPPASEGAAVQSGLPGRPFDLEEAERLVRGSREGNRNATLNKVAFTAAGNPDADEDEVRALLVCAAQQAGLTSREAAATFRSGWAAGRKRPRR